MFCEFARMLLFQNSPRLVRSVVLCRSPQCHKFVVENCFEGMCGVSVLQADVRTVSVPPQHVTRRSFQCLIMPFQKVSYELADCKSWHTANLALCFDCALENVTFWIRWVFFVWCSLTSLPCDNIGTKLLNFPWKVCETRDFLVLTLPPV